MPMPIMATAEMALVEKLEEGKRKFEIYSEVHFEVLFLADTFT